LSKLQLRIFDGSRQLFSAPTRFLVTITDGNQKQLKRDYFDKPAIDFDDLPFYDNFGDSFSVVVWAEGYRQAGFFPVKLSEHVPTTLDIMLVENDLGFSFVNARWSAVGQKYPFLGGDTDPVSAQTRYENLLDQQPKVLACFLNLVEAMGQIFLAQGTPLDYIKQIRWDRSPQQDRFFAYCDAKLVEQVSNAELRGLFSREAKSSLFHPGSTNSWKQIQFGEANVLLTFHENEPDRTKLNGVDCVTLEPDIDYYQDLGAHSIFEVVPNTLTHNLTDPVEVYVLRWIAGQHAGVPQFDPLYTLTSVQPAIGLHGTRPVPGQKNPPKLKKRKS
jgi:hypothetical protein